MQFTIIRPGGLKTEAATGNGVLTGAAQALLGHTHSVTHIITHIATHAQPACAHVVPCCHLLSAEDASVCGSITRADVADLVIKALLSDASANKTLSAVDRNGVFGDAEVPEFAL